MKYKHVRPLLGPVNFLLLQWLTCRIFIGIHAGGAPLRERHIIRAGLYYGIVPLTGWLTPYSFFKRNNFNGRAGRATGQIDLWQKQ